MSDAEYVKLHKDTGGEYIREHDKVDWRDHAGTWHENATVVAVCNDGCYVMDGAVFHVHKSDIRHHHAPTVEDVLREFGRGWHEQMNAPETFDIADYVERYAAKLRLAGDAETCRQEERGWTTEGDHARVFLTCGHDCMVETVADLPNFCPVCGARVEAAK